MRQLSPREARLLSADTPRANSNITFVQIYDQGGVAGGVLRFKAILAHIEGRLPLCPILRDKLLRVPFDLDDPYWMEDENFDLEYHVRHIALPQPGDWRQFCIQASRIHARALDMSRPLWEIYVIEGLDGIAGMPAGSFALLTKIHRAATDAAQPAAIVAALHDTTRRPRKPAPPPPWFPDAPPGALALALHGAWRMALGPLAATSPLLRLAATAQAFARDVLRPQHTVATRFNSVVSPHRVFDSARLRLDELERIRRLVPGASLDDVVLAVVGGGLRRYLLAHDELPAAGLTALLRAPDAAPGSPWRRLRLGSTLADARQRLALIHAQRDPAQPAPGPQEEADEPELDGCRVVDVPAPAAPRYLCGARLTLVSALLPIADGMALVFALTRYDGEVVVSPTSCRELMPDPQLLTQCLRDALAEYLALAPPLALPAGVRRTAPRPASAGDRPGPAPPRARSAASAPPVAQGDRRRSRTPRR